MSLINRLKQLAATGIALTSFAEASNNMVQASDEVVDNMPTAVQSHTFMDAKTATIELYKHFKEAEKRIKNMNAETQAQIAHAFIQHHNISDKNVYDMMLNYSKYVTEYSKNINKKKVNDNALKQEIEAVYSAFTQTDFYKTERDKIIKRWMPMAEAVSEGYFRHGYKCTAGYPTIGIGTCLTTSGLSLNDIPIRKIQKGANGQFLYANKEPIPGRELTLAEKKQFCNSLEKLNSTSYEDGATLTKNMGVYGLTLVEARKVATLESQKKMDQILKFAFLSQKVDLFQEPTTLGVLALDIHYQCGNLTNINEWPSFWECVRNKNYVSLKNQIKVNGGQNKRRHLVKQALCEHIAAAHACKTETKAAKKIQALAKRNLAYDKICGYGVDIYGLKRREGPSSAYYHSSGIGMAKAVSGKIPTLKKHKISPEQKEKFENIKKMIREHNANQTPSHQQSVSSSPVAEGPYIKISGKTLRELQKKTKAVPKDKRADHMSSQELIKLAQQNNINSKNLIHLTTHGGVDINVCIDYLKMQTQKINRATMQRKRSQGR